jgi:hypothetical protein
MSAEAFLTLPDRVECMLNGELIPLSKTTAGCWSSRRASITLRITGAEQVVEVESPQVALSAVHLRWKSR